MQIYGLIGYPVKHSISPLIHNAGFKKIGLPAEYRLFELSPERLEDFLLKDIPIKDTEGRTFSSQNIVGFNITIPHKVRAREILEREFPYDKDAPVMEETLHYVKLLGAINTARRSSGKVEYRNTDAPGFLESLQKDLNFNTQGRNALVIGCGGGGRAVIAALSWKQNEIKNIYVTDIKEEAVNSARDYFSRFQYINEKLKFITEENIPGVIGDCDLLVNASPCGMKESDPCPVDEKSLRKNLAVFDLIYNPKETKLLKIARGKDAPAVNGLGMLLYQGTRAFEFWTENKAPVEVMRQALNQGVKDLL